MTSAQWNPYLVLHKLSRKEAEDDSKIGCCGDAITHHSNKCRNPLPWKDRVQIHSMLEMMEKQNPREALEDSAAKNLELLANWSLCVDNHKRKAKHDLLIIKWRGAIREACEAREKLVHEGEEKIALQTLMTKVEGLVAKEQEHAKELRYTKSIIKELENRLATMKLRETVDGLNIKVDKMELLMESELSDMRNEIDVYRSENPQESKPNLEMSGMDEPGH